MSHLHTRGYLHLALLMTVLLGCMAQESGVKKQVKKPTGKSTLSDAAYESFQQRDIVRAELIEQAIKDIESDQLKYDQPCMDRLAKIGAEASEKTWKSTAQSAQAVMAGDKWDKAKAISVFRSIQEGSRRAGK